MTAIAAIPNPFVFGQVLHVGAPYCARVDEEAEIASLAAHCQRVVLLGDRRMGKSSLVEHTLAEGKALLLTVDLRGLTSVDDFVERMAARLERLLDEQKPLNKVLPSAVQEALDLVAKVRLRLGPFVEVETQRRPNATTVMQAMNAVERVSKWKPIVVFFDEFQEIADNLAEPEAKHLLGLLRAEIQRHPKVAYLFAGSAKASMNEIFTAEHSHFYQTARILEIGPLPRKAMEHFLVDQFGRGGRTLSDEALNAFFSLSGDSPNDIQQLAYHLWARTIPGEIGASHLREALTTLLSEMGRRGEDLLDDINPSQRRILFALALREGEDFYRNEFIRFAGFASKQSADRAMRHFLKGKKAVLEKTGSKVRFRERFLRLWVLAAVMRSPSIFPRAKPSHEIGISLLRPFLLGDSDL